MALGKQKLTKRGTDVQIGLMKAGNFPSEVRVPTADQAPQRRRVTLIRTVAIFFDSVWRRASEAGELALDKRHQSYSDLWAEEP